MLFINVAIGKIFIFRPFYRNKMPEVDMLKVIEDFPDMIENASQLGTDVNLGKDFSSVMTTGMGASGIHGDFLKAAVSVKVPIVVNKDYELPEFVSSKSLVFAITYSGKTEETISAFKAALRKNAPVVGITSGLEFREMCRKNEKPCILVPSGIPPRAALAYLFFPILNVLYNGGMIKNPEEEIKATAHALRNPVFKERARELAEKLVNKVPIIYATEKLAPVALRWRQQLNENSKVLAVSNVFPELDHNELAGYAKLNSDHHAVIIRDEADSMKMKERIRLTKELISERGIPTTEIVVKGDSTLTKLFTAVYIGDLASYFLAVNNGVDPVETNVQEELKKRLSKIK